MNHKATPVILLPIVLLLSLVSTAAASTNWYVDGVSGNDSNSCMSSRTACKTIGRAVALASSGDSITIAAATYVENLTLSISLNITGAGAGKTIIDGGGINSVVNIPDEGVTITISKVTLRNGSARDGAGIFNYATLTVNSSAITQNTGTANGEDLSSGAGIFNYGTLTVNNSTICRNGSVGNGGGIANYGTVTINTSNITQNSATKIGGGLLNAGGGTASIVNSTFNANAAVYAGGGLDNFSGTSWVTNSTFYGNTATNNGGGIFNGSGSVTISSSTISGNSATYGGGLWNNSGIATFQNSIIVNSASGGNCWRAVVSNGYNLSSDATCQFANSGDLIDTNPLLALLGQNGGPTMTMALPAGSPALDAGNPTGCTDGQGHTLTTDQRGDPRPGLNDHSGCDIGAYESQTD